MPTAGTEQKTDDKGAEVVDVTSTVTTASVAPNNGSVTPTETKVEVAKVVIPDEPEIDDSDDDEQEDLDGKPTLSRSDVNAIVQKRLDRQKAKLTKTHAADIQKVSQQVEAIQKERDDFAAVVRVQVKTEYDALPDTVKAMIQVDMDTPDGLRQVQAWLPNAKVLAGQLTAAPMVVKPAEGNGTNPPPAGIVGSTTTLREAVTEGRSHSIYRRSF